MKRNLEEQPIDRLLREKENDAIEVHNDGLEFLSPDRNSTSKLIVNRVLEELYIETSLYHSIRMVEQNIFLASNILSDKFSEEQIREIIEDISARLRTIELPNMLKIVQYGFKIIEQQEDFTRFSYTLIYGLLTYEELRTQFETILMNSFELIYSYLIKIGFFIQGVLNQFLLQPEIELKLLAIRTLLFRAEFYEKMTGRFANEQKRIAHSMQKEARDLIAQFRKEFPEIAEERLKEYQNLWE
ncbi:MAG TPA: hypothetical protein VMV49_14370 [Candidatus Deferrimicrobium sp.]|nr:hypothetical protein [Candidatus Deferrimicrobium sp.]